MGREGSYKLQPNGTLILPTPLPMEGHLHPKNKPRPKPGVNVPVHPPGRLLKSELGFLHLCSAFLNHLLSPSHPTSRMAWCSLVPGPGRSLGSRGGRAYRLPELHALQPSSVSLRGRCPASPSLSICVPASTSPCCSCSLSPPWKNAPLPPDLPTQGQSGREAVYGPIFLGSGKLFWK